MPSMQDVKYKGVLVLDDNQFRDMGFQYGLKLGMNLDDCQIFLDKGKHLYPERADKIISFLRTPSGAEDHLRKHFGIQACQYDAK